MLSWQVSLNLFSRCLAPCELQPYLGLFHNLCPPDAVRSLRTSLELVDNPWKFPQQLLSPSSPTWDLACESYQPKDTEPGSRSGPGSIYDFVSQGLGLGTLYSGNLLLSSPVNTRLYLEKRRTVGQINKLFLHRHPIDPVSPYVWFILGLGPKSFNGNKGNF